MFAIAAARVSPEEPLAGLELGERPDPKAADGWEIVRVKAAALNHHDLWTLRGVGIKSERLPIVLGCDAAGVTADGREVVVHAVISGEGSGAETLDGFSLFSEQHDGTHAELLAAPSRNLIDKPEELSFVEAACLPTAWLTAYRMLFTQSGAKPGNRILIQGAGGGVATAAILLARAAGLRVYVTSRDQAKRQRALELGAHEVFESGARLPERVEAVLETVGEATWGHSLRALESGGTIVVSGATSGPNPPADLQRVFYRQLRIVGSTMGSRAEFVALIRMLEATGIRPLVDSTFALEQGRDAYARLAEGDMVGKIVLTAD